MFKLLILLTVAALSSASDYDALLGEWTIVAATSAESPSTACNKFTIEKSEGQCKCGGKDVPVLALKVSKPDSEVKKFVPFLVSSVAEVDSALHKNAEDCSCGEAIKIKHVVRTLSDNYSIVYAITEEKTHEGALLRKAVTSKSDFEAFIQNVEDFKGKNYTMLCDVFSS